MTSAKPTSDRLSHLFEQGWVKRDQLWRASSIEQDACIETKLTEKLTDQNAETSNDMSNGAGRGVGNHIGFGNSFGNGISSGYKELDCRLANRGWPAKGLTEILHDHSGLGEMRLLTPALAQLSQQQNRWIVWVSPPYLPYAPALAKAGVNLNKLLVVMPENHNDQLWTLEKAMTSGSCSAVLAWPKQIQYKQLRRLQVASKTGDCLGVLYRASREAKQSSPAELRIRLRGEQDRSAFSDQSMVNVQILKRKGGWPGEPFNVTLADNLNQVTPEFHELTVPEWRQKQPNLVYMEQLSGDRHVLQ